MPVPHNGFLMAPKMAPTALLTPWEAPHITVKNGRPGIQWANSELSDQSHEIIPLQMNNPPPLKDNLLMIVLFVCLSVCGA